MPKRELRRSIRSLTGTLHQYQPKLQAGPAILGDGAGKVATSRPNYCFARLGMADGGDIIEIYNDRTAYIDNLPVIVGFEATQSDLFQVLSVRHVYDGQGFGNPPPYGSLREHHLTHEWLVENGGNDVVYIDIRQWMPVRVFAGAGLTVQVWHGVVRRVGKVIPVDFQTLSLSSHQPSDGARYVLITINQNGLLTATPGTIVDNTILLTTEDHIPVTPAGHLALAAVRLYSGQTQITESRTVQDIVDLRYPQERTSESSPVQVEEIDGVPSLQASIVRFHNDQLVDLGSGIVRVKRLELLTNGDVTNPEVVFSNGDAVFTWK